MRASEFASLLERLADAHPDSAGWCALLVERLRLHAEDRPEEFARRLWLKKSAAPRGPRSSAKAPADTIASKAIRERLAAARADIRAFSMEEIDALCAEAATLPLAALQGALAGAGFVHLEARTKGRLVERLTQTLKNARASHH